MPNTCFDWFFEPLEKCSPSLLPPLGSKMFAQNQILYNLDENVKKTNNNFHRCYFLPNPKPKQKIANQKKIRILISRSILILQLNQKT